MYKVLFLDMDNTIAENYTCQDVSFEPGMYLKKRPIGFVIDAVNKLLRPQLECLVIVSQVQGYEIGANEKQAWLKEHNIQFDVFLPIMNGGRKFPIMSTFCTTHGYHPNECLLIDDKKTILQEAAQAGFNVMYPQQLITEYYLYLKRN